MGARTKGLRHLGAVLASATLAILTVSAVLAWNHNGYYWPPASPDAFPLTYRFYDVDDPGDGVSQGTQDAFTMAAYYWETESNSPADFTYTTSSADVTCYEEDGGAAGWSGRWVHGGSYELSWAYAILNTYYTAGYPSGKRISTAGHELGHVLGLAHVDNNLMDPSDYWRWNILGIEDPEWWDIYELSGRYPP